MKIVVPVIAAVAAALTLAPAANAVPCGDDCGNPYYDPNFPNNAQFLQNVYETGITGPPHSLISGALNDVCSGLDAGESEQNIVADLEKYAGYNRYQVYTYVNNSVIHYCPPDADKLSR